MAFFIVGIVADFRARRKITRHFSREKAIHLPAIPAEAPYEGSEKSVKISLSNGAKQFKEKQVQILRIHAFGSPMKKCSAGTAVHLPTIFPCRD